jgi:hypothetical protein
MSIQAPSNADNGFGDLSFVERNEAPRKLVGLPGHYKLQGWKDSQGRNRHFPCKILKVSPHAIKFSASVSGPVGHWVEVNFEHLGKFQGPIIQASHQALTMKIVGTKEDQVKVANKLAWITDTNKSEGRRYPRMVPSTPDSSVCMPDGLVVPCEIIDYSIGGAAVYTDVSADLNTLVKIGHVQGRVIRKFIGGLAVAFLTLQNPESLEASILQPPPPSPAS